MLHGHSLVVCDAVLISIVLEVHHNEGVSSADLLGWLDNRGLIEGRCVGIDSVDDVSA